MAALDLTTSLDLSSLTDLLMPDLAAPPADLSAVTSDLARSDLISTSADLLVAQADLGDGLGGAATGCSCRMTPSNDGATVPLLVVVLLLAAGLRRRWWPVSAE